MVRTVPLTKLPSGHSPIYIKQNNAVKGKEAVRINERDYPWRITRGPYISLCPLSW